MSSLTNIYFIRCGEFVKIGRGLDPEKRARDLQVGNPYEIEVIGSFAASEDEEARLHDAFRQFHHRAEWFFLSATIRAFITQHCNSKRAPARRRYQSITALRPTLPDGEMLAGVRDFLADKVETKEGAGGSRKYCLRSLPVVVRAGKATRIHLKVVWANGCRARD